MSMIKFNMLSNFPYFVYDWRCCIPSPTPIYPLESKVKWVCEVVRVKGQSLVEKVKCGTTME